MANQSPAQIRKQITDQIVAALEADQIPWRRPWSLSPNSGRPASVATGKPYSGINPLLLELHSLKHGFTSRWWATYRQWQELGCQVRRRPAGVKAGQWGATIVFYKQIARTVEDRQTGEEREERIPMLRTFTVFNADQVEGEAAKGLQVHEPDIPAEPATLDYQPAEELITATGADVRHGGDRAAYAIPMPKGSWPNHAHGDYIQLPPRSTFNSTSEYYATALHELAHWSEVRLDFNADYAMCELVAEMASVFMATELAIPQSHDLSNHRRYLKGWLRRMNDDPKWMFTASTQASKVTDYLLSFIDRGVASNEPEAAETE